MSIASVQLIRKAVLCVAVIFGLAILAFVGSKHPPGSTTHEAVEGVGAILIIICILGRTWCTLYIGGRKIEQLISQGPYSVCRNPLYFFSILGAAGAGAQHGSVTSGLIFGAFTWLVFRVVVAQEEQFLSKRHGAAFAAYMATVPRFVPDPLLWRDSPTITVAPSKILQTFADAMFLLLAWPAAEIFEHLQGLGVLPVLVRLP